MKNEIIILLSGIYSSCLILANISSNKLSDLFGYTIDSGFYFFPLTYIINDILTESYGYKTSRKVVLIGFLSNLIVILGLNFTINLPPSKFYSYQKEWEVVFDQTLRIFIASSVSYFAGELLNGFSLDWMKKRTEGKYMAGRFLLSTMIGAAIENTIFYSVAFVNIVPLNELIEMATIQYCSKILYELLLLPFSCMISQIILKKFVQA